MSACRYPLCKLCATSRASTNRYGYTTEEWAGKTPYETLRKMTRGDRRQAIRRHLLWRPSSGTRP